MKLFFLFFVNTYAFILNVPINTYKYDYNSQVIKVYELKLLDKKDMNAIVFYTGANSLIPADIYSNFIKSLNNYNFSVSVVTNDNDATVEMLYNIRDEYKEIILLTHLSGYVNAIQSIQKQKNIKKAVFLDSVDNSELLNTNVFNFFNNNNKVNIKYLKSILILNAEKSYKGYIFPKLKIPFIPVFGLNIKNFEKNYPDLNIEKITTNDYGHSDVLDSLWSDLMHITLTKGSENRNQDNMNEYVNWLAEKIYNFLNIDLDEDLNIDKNFNTVSSE